jgi:hypothetical protein
LCPAADFRPPVYFRVIYELVLASGEYVIGVDVLVNETGFQGVTRCRTCRAMTFVLKDSGP